MPANPDHFALFSLPLRLDLSIVEVEAAYRRLQRQHHPDNFVTADPSQRQGALLKSAAVNDAYQVLKDPLKRARYWCELKGVAVVELPHTILAGQWQWRERLEDAEGDAVALQALAGELSQYCRTLEERVRGSEEDAAACALLVLEWQFAEKLREALEQALERTETAS